jgi:hypothetical protein
MAIAYKGHQISIYHNGESYASYEASNIDLLSGKDNMAVFGLRHEGAGAARTCTVRLRTPGSMTGRGDQETGAQQGIGNQTLRLVGF